MTNSSAAALNLPPAGRSSGAECDGRVRVPSRLPLVFGLR